MHFESDKGEKFKKEQKRMENFNFDALNIIIDEDETEENELPLIPQKYLDDPHIVIKNMTAGTFDPVTKEIPIQFDMIDTRTNEMIEDNEPER